ncbi:MAG: hypothetical protein ACXWC7_17865 [Chitinophagaceae bacterium]
MKSAESAISFWLDDFNDIYSDFDSRHYIKRRISEDFLHELSLSLKDTDVKSKNLVLLIPQQKRDEDVERNIITSLETFFKEQFHIHEKNLSGTFRKGFAMLLAGIIIMVVNFVFGYKYQQSFLLSLLKVLLEPAGWFLIWAALDTLYYDLSAIRKDRNHFAQLSQIKIHFRSAE